MSDLFNRKLMGQDPESGMWWVRLNKDDSNRITDVQFFKYKSKALRFYKRHWL